MSFVLTCPNCGPREVTDFRFGGELVAPSPDQPDNGVLTRGDEVVADGWTAHAVVDRETLRPTRLPEWLAEAVAAAEAA